MSISRTVFGIAATAALSAALVACSPPNQQDSSVQRTNEILTTSQSPTTTSSNSTSSATATSSAAPVEEDVEIVVSPATLIDGEQVTFEISGLDPQGGYYAAICDSVANPGNPVPTCTGETADFTSQAWLSNSQPGATVRIANDGTATVDLKATATGTGLDCTVQECVAKIFGDHTEGFRNVAEVPVTFAAA